MGQNIWCVLEAADSTILMSVQTQNQDLSRLGQDGVFVR